MNKKGQALKNNLNIIAFLICVLLVCAPVEGMGEALKIHPDDASEQDLFGHSVAFKGGVLVVGAIGDSQGAYSSGSVYVFQQQEGGWKQTAKLLPSKAVAYGNFGYSVDVDGDTIVVGAPGFDQSGGDSGAIFVFRKENSAGWKLENTLIPSDTSAGDYFGSAVSVNLDRILAGAYADDDTMGASGSAYIFRRTNDGWNQEIKLHASDPEMEAYFGSSVDLQDSLAVVGAWGKDAPEIDSGSLYVFSLTSNGWREQAKLSTERKTRNAKLGTSVCLDGFNILAGAPGAGRYGSGFLYRIIGDVWTLVGELTAPTGQTGDSVGHSIGFNAQYLCLGGPNSDTLAQDCGNLTLYQNVSDRWTLRSEPIPSDPADRDNFGISMFCPNNTCLSEPSMTMITAIHPAPSICSICSNFQHSLPLLLEHPLPNQPSRPTRTAPDAHTPPPDSDLHTRSNPYPGSNNRYHIRRFRKTQQKPRPPRRLTIDGLRKADGSSRTLCRKSVTRDHFLSEIIS